MVNATTCKNPHEIANNSIKVVANKVKEMIASMKVLQNMTVQMKTWMDQALSALMT